jgi:hypothetical protein
MTRRNRLLSIASLAATMLAVVAAAASATTFSLVERSFTATWRTMTFETTGSRVTCPLTLAGSFHANTFTKTARSRIGTITSASVGTCTGGTATILRTLPWTLQYSAFGGTLPNITEFDTRVVGASISITASGVTCLAGSDEAEPLVITFPRAENGDLTGVTIDESAAIDLDDPGFLCSIAGDARVSGSGTYTTTPSGAPIKLLLGELATGAVEVRGAPMDPLVIAPDDRENSTSITTNDAYALNITLVQLIGTNQEKFEVKQEEASSCGVGITSIVRNGPSCNIRVRVRDGVARPVSSTVEFAWTWGFWATRAKQTFTVTAE